ncbi:MAG: VOC family protein [Actinobacteria bacterium]|nr:VOC family protein [Actinomycetota bacterium]
MRRGQTPAGAPTWIDLMSADTDRARTFYGELLGWECGEANPEMGGYANFTRDGVLVAGLLQKQEATLPDFWSVYLEVPDAAAAAAVCESSGGQLFLGPQAVGDLGAMVVAGDVGGAVIGMWESGTHTGFGVVEEPGAATWFELLTPAYDASLDFYREVFGWTVETMSDTPELRYSVLTIDGIQYAGIMDSAGHADGSPPMWSVYLQVESTDASCTEVESLGGSIVRQAVDTPYGRLAGCADPMGAPFNLMQPPG